MLKTNVDKINDKPNWLTRWFASLSGTPIDRSHFLKLLQSAEQKDLLDGKALDMMEGVMKLSEMRVRDIMVPRSHMIVIDKDWALERSIGEITKSGHSRFPVMGDKRDEVIGILLAKDLLGCLYRQGLDDLQLRDILRTVEVVPESKHLDALLKEFQANRNHMAIVVDEYGGVAGLVTIEDVLEEIVGEIEDEQYVDDDESDIKEQSNGRYWVNALTHISEFNHFFHSELEDSEFDTIGGLVMSALGQLPSGGEQVDMQGYLFKVLRAGKRRIQALEVTKMDQNSANLTTEASD